MRRYYIGPKKRVIATLNSNDGQDLHNYTKKVEIIDKYVTFYYNFFGALVEEKTGFPTIRAEELPDLIEYDFKNGHNTTEINFVDEKDLERIAILKPVVPLHTKVLKKIKRTM